MMQEPSKEKFYSLLNRAVRTDVHNRLDTFIKRE